MKKIRKIFKWADRGKHRLWLVNLGDQVEKWRERCTRLDVCEGKLAKLLLDK